MLTWKYFNKFIHITNRTFIRQLHCYIIEIISDIINIKNPVEKKAKLIPNGFTLYLLFLLIVKLKMIVPITKVMKPYNAASIINK